MTSPAEGHKIRVMLIDDGSIFLSSVLTFLQQVPEVKVVGTVGGCEEAVAQAQLLRAHVVILGLTTYGLPELQVIARLHVSSPQIGVIVLTLRDLAPYREAALAAGAAEFVSRANAGKDLMPAIRRAAAASKESKRSQTPFLSAAEKKATGKNVEHVVRP